MFTRNKPECPRASLAKQLGNGLLGLIAGLLLAVLIIIAILWMLNSNRMRDFKEDPNARQQPVQQEVVPNTRPAVSEPALQDMQPQASAVGGESVLSVGHEGASAASSVSEGLNGGTAMQENTDDAAASEAVRQPVDAPKPDSGKGDASAQTERVPDAAAAVPGKPARPSSNLSSGSNAHSHSAQAGSSRNQTGTVKGTSVFRPEDESTSRRTQADNRTRRQTQTPPKPPRRQQYDEPRVAVMPPAKPRKPVEKVQNNKPSGSQQTQTAKSKHSGSNTPSPALILESGSIEKAREAAKRQAAAKQGKGSQQAKAPAKATAKPAQSGGNVVIQAGSFMNAKSADAQRARLAMMGVNTRIVKAEVNGKSVYRVQTQNMNGAKAAQTRSRLQQNGVSVYERSGE